jgi:hypothetical protein
VVSGAGKLLKIKSPEQFGTDKKPIKTIRSLIAVPKLSSEGRSEGGCGQT